MVISSTYQSSLHEQHEYLMHLESEVHRLSLVVEDAQCKQQTHAKSHQRKIQSLEEEVERLQSDCAHKDEECAGLRDQLRRLAVERVQELKQHNKHRRTSMGSARKPGKLDEEEEMDRPDGDDEEVHADKNNPLETTPYRPQRSQPPSLLGTPSKIGVTDLTSLGIKICKSIAVQTDPMMASPRVVLLASPHRLTTARTTSARSKADEEAAKAMERRNRNMYVMKWTCMLVLRWVSWPLLLLRRALFHPHRGDE